MQYAELAAVFQEIERGFSPQEAVAEASRCLKCEDAPCAKECPAQIDVSKFIRQIATRNFNGAIRVIKEDNILAGTCARICPQKYLCEGACSSSELAEPIKIGKLQRFAADQEMEKGPKRMRSLPAKGICMAVVGSGPAGLSAATVLSRLGYSVDLYEAASHLGGVLTYGIPPYRLPKQLVRQEIEYIQSLGVNIFRAHTIDDPRSLLENYQGVFLGTGVSRPIGLNVPGRELSGVLQALDLLREVNMALLEQRSYNLNTGRRVVVIGGGNAAIDAAVTLRRLGAEKATILYRRSEDEMPAWEKEREFAKAQGVEIRLLIAPTRFIGENERLVGVECICMQLGEPDASGRKRPVPIDGSELRIACDTAILALGQGPSSAIDGFEQDARGLLKVDPQTLATSVPGIYAGGDLIRGSDMAVRAVGDGKLAALAMDARCREESAKEPHRKYIDTSKED